MQGKRPLPPQGTPALDFLLLESSESRETARNFGERAFPAIPQEALLYMLQAFAGLINAGKGSPRPPGDSALHFLMPGAAEVQAS